MRVLLAGESRVTHSVHVKGVDSFSTSTYVEGADRLREALAAAHIEVDDPPAHLVPARFPGTAAELAEYGAIILSDIGANSLLLAPDTFERRPRAKPAGRDRAVRARGRRAADDRRLLLLRRDRREGALPRHAGRGGAAGHDQRG